MTSKRQVLVTLYKIGDQWSQASMEIEMRMRSFLVSVQWQLEICNQLLAMGKSKEMDIGH